MTLCALGVRAVAGITVGRLVRAELHLEPPVERRRQGNQGPQGEVLASRQHLADPPRGYAHPPGEVGPGHVILAHAPVDLVGDLGDQARQLLVDPGGWYSGSWPATSRSPCAARTMA